MALFTTDVLTTAVTLFTTDVWTTAMTLFTTYVWKLQWHCSLQRSEHCTDIVHYRCLNTAVTLFIADVWTTAMILFTTDIWTTAVTLFTTDVWTTAMWHCSLQTSEHCSDIVHSTRLDHFNDTVHSRCLKTAMTLFISDVLTLQWHCSFQMS